jgi:hypothetical protein
MTVHAAAPIVTQGLTHTQTSLSLLGITIVCLILATFIRRRVPRLAASIAGRFASMRGAFGARGSRSGSGRGRAAAGTLGAGSRTGSLNLAGLARAALGWIAVILFAVAGVAASGTFIGTTVVWFAHLANSFITLIIGLFPGGHQDAKTIGVSIVALLILLWGMNHYADAIEGRLHHGGRDWLVFSGPMLFTLVPGYFGQWSTTAYAALGSHVGPIVAQLMQGR